MRVLINALNQKRRSAPLSRPMQQCLWSPLRPLLLEPLYHLIRASNSYLRINNLFILSFIRDSIGYVLPPSTGPPFEAHPSMDEGLGGQLE